MTPSDTPAAKAVANFPKTARLRQSGEFQKLKREGTSLHGKLMVLSVIRTQPPTGARIGLITSRRVGGAVTRNLVRRRLREIIRVDRAQLAPDCWLVLIARQRAATADFADLRSEWRALASRGGILTVKA